MITKKTSGKYSLMRYIPAVITVVALFISFSCSDEINEEKPMTREDINIVKITKTKEGVILTTKDGKELVVNSKKDMDELRKVIYSPPTNINKVKDHVTTTNSGEEVFVVVEDMPEFPGGIKALYKFISQNVKYPVKAKKKGITGRVFVGFVIDTDGSITNAKVLRPFDPDLDKEALRVINAMPKWKPGTQRGKKVKVSYTIPINFSLK